MPDVLVHDLYRPASVGEESGIVAFERTEDVERGLRLIPNLVEVMPERADESVLEVYESETSPQERYTYLYLPRWRVQGNLPFLDTIETNRGAWHHSCPTVSLT